MKSLEKYLVISLILNGLETKLSASEGYSIDSDVKWGSSQSRIRFDILVSRYGRAVAIFEFCSCSELLSSAISQLGSYISKNIPNSVFVIYTLDNQKYKIYLTGKPGELLEPIETFDINDVVNYIKTNSNIIPNSKNYNRRFPDIVKAWNDAHDTTASDPSKPLRDYLKPYDKNTICRYSSLNSLFSTLKHNTMRMNGLPGMNDNTEGFFALKYIDVKDPDKVTYETIFNRKKSLNNIFIVSFSDSNLEDNLTQWRLYGDDAKGVCCVYEIDKDEVKDRFFLNPVNYKKKPKKGMYRDPLLKKLKKSFEEDPDFLTQNLFPGIFFYNLNSAT